MPSDKSDKAERQPQGPSRFFWIKSISKYSAIIAVLALTASYFGTIFWREWGDIEFPILSLSDAIGYLMAMAVISGFIAGLSYVSWHQLNEKRANPN